MTSAIRVAIACVALSATAAIASEPINSYQQWVEEMKSADRGPFSRLRWFCSDGTVLPPLPYACADHGGGVQHGELSKKASALRDNGYFVATTLAGLDADKANKWVASQGFGDQYNQLLIEKFLANIDNGWIFRRGQYYRGAVQEEDERKGARQLLVSMLASDEWYEQRYGASRIGARLLAHGTDTASAQKVRQLAASLSDQDKNFLALRAKIHGAPAASDADRVREYASSQGRPELQAQYRGLAEEIDRVYTSNALPLVLEAAAQIFSKGPWLQKILHEAASQYGQTDKPAEHYRITASLLADIRNAMSKIRSPGARLRLIDVSLAVEADNFTLGESLLEMAPKATREQQLAWLADAFTAAYGTGQINPRLAAEGNLTFNALDTTRIALDAYLSGLNYLARAPGWATQTLRYQFYESMQKLAEIEPLALHFIQDQLRGSPLLGYSQILNGLSRDANHLAGVKHHLFSDNIGSGFHALNSGLARGKLYTHAKLDDFDDFDTRGIYLLPETISDLPPLAGIITAGEGNPLSHVQLLARNLGIPNITIDDRLISKLKKHEGETIVLAVSPLGLVEISADSAEWRALFEQNSVRNIVIKPDLEKLDTRFDQFVDLNDLRAADSGRIVGPKAAKLGELRLHFPEMVSPGVAIPFGVFRETVLDKPYKNSSQSVYQWMLEEYAKIKLLDANSQQQKNQSERFRAELHQLILDSPLGEQSQNALRTAMVKAFGQLDTLGVFVRSDTNVEDLPGFTGAGLNLTLPNVIGFGNVVRAVSEVWASPFTRRAFAWRQSHMDEPQYVYPAVLLLKSVANDKSGVMVTQDIDTGHRGTLSIAVNEGVGGAVDGQSAESLRVDMTTGGVRVLATATAPWQRLPSKTGGIVKLPSSGSYTVLQESEIRQMIRFATELPQRFPEIIDDRGNSAPADVEFGFLDGRMHLFQLRPFLQSRQAQTNAYLIGMDQSLRVNKQRQINLNEIPQ